jgi:hypothetical protein
VCDRTAVWRIESGPDVNSCSSNCAISNSLYIGSVRIWCSCEVSVNVREVAARLC